MLKNFLFSMIKNACKNDIFCILAPYLRAWK
jgi:hypothetical protein